MAANLIKNKNKANVSKPAAAPTKKPVAIKAVAAVKTAAKTKA